MEIVSGYPHIHVLILIIRRLRKAYGHDATIVVKLHLNFEEGYVTVGKVFSMDHNLSNSDRFDITEIISV